MKPRYGPTPIPIPSAISDAKHIGRFSREVRKSVCALRDRSVIVRGGNGQSGGGYKPNPFDVRLIVIPAEGEGDPTYEVMVMDGWVNERIPGVQDPATNATAVHKPWNILWGDDASGDQLATDRRTFPIAIGDQVSILVNVAAEGNSALPDGSTADGPTEIAIEDEDEKSIHYVPPRPVDSDEGAAGVYHYKMAVLRDADATHSGPWLELFLAGSHLDHFAELPILDNMSGEADNKGRVFKEYDPETNTYNFRVLDATVGELTITENEDGVEIRGNENDGTLTVTIEGESPATVLEWTDGLIDQSGTTNIDIPAAYEPPAGWWGVCSFKHFAEVGDTEPYLVLEQTFENGVLTAVAVQEPGGTLTAVTGTEGAPGTAEFASNGGNL